MASPETLSQAADLLIDDYRGFFGNKGAFEVHRQPLIAHHDPTIHFTNSTTSVMKPYIEAALPLESCTYLTQPAMGAQGIGFWLSDRKLGPFSSYFTSLGSIYPEDDSDIALQDMLALALDIWDLDPKRLHVEVHSSDRDLGELLSNAKVEAYIFDDNMARFRHRYGLAETSGRNINLCFKKNDGTIRQLGSLTHIMCLPSKTNLWEVSFDSTPVLESQLNLEHPILSLPISARIRDILGHSDESLVASDCAAVASALLLEGLEPTSRGKSGILRKFFKEYVLLMQAEGGTQEDTTDVLLQAIDTEVASRTHLSDESTCSINHGKAELIAIKWVELLSKT